MPVSYQTSLAQILAAVARLFYVVTGYKLEKYLLQLTEKIKQTKAINARTELEKLVREHAQITEEVNKIRGICAKIENLASRIGNCEIKVNELSNLIGLLANLVDSKLTELRNDESISKIITPITEEYQLMLKRVFDALKAENPDMERLLGELNTAIRTAAPIAVYIPENHCCGCSGSCVANSCCFWRSRNQIFDGSFIDTQEKLEVLVRARGDLITRYNRANSALSYTSYLVAFLVAVLEAVRILLDDIASSNRSSSEDSASKVASFGKIDTSVHFVMVAVPILAAIIYKIATRCAREAEILITSIDKQLSDMPFFAEVLPPIPQNPDADTSDAKTKTTPAASMSSR